MVYRRKPGNIRKPRRRTSVRRRAPARKSYSRRRTTSRRRVKNDCQCPGELSATAKFALAQLDPFEPKCLGAKVPDSNTMPSLANCDTDLVPITAGGTSGFLTGAAFLPTYATAYHVAAGASATTVAWSSGINRTKYSQVCASVEAIRPVAHAIRLSCPTAPTSTTGFVHIGLDVESRWSQSNTATTVPEFPITVDQMAGLAHYKRVTLASLTQSPITVINKWIDESGFRYNDPRAAANYTTGVDSSVGTTIASALTIFNFNSSWGALIVLVEGSTGVSTTLLSVEHILLTECLPRKDAFILGTGAAPNSPGTMSAVSSMVADQDFAHTEAQQESYVNEGIHRFSQGAAIAGERVWNDVAAPLMTRLGSAAINTGVAMAINAYTGRGGIQGVNSNPNRLTL
ncbi:MAG: capsid protein [Cressdnaviricota sp.]|nr:MAG: capsid protein [Cressdnaviricota sp.]